MLQTDRVFLNVSKGEFARKEDLCRAFGHDGQRKICMEILEQGELQISPKEREHMFESTFRDIVNIVCNKCINPHTQRPYPPSIIEKTIRQDIKFAVRPNRTAKQQALELIRRLAAVIPIERAQMRLRLVLPSTAAAGVQGLKRSVERQEGTVEREEYREADRHTVLTVLIDPGMFREVDEFVTRLQQQQQRGGSGGATLEVLDSCVQQIGEMAIDELQSQQQQQQQANAAKTTIEGSDQEQQQQQVGDDEDVEEGHVLSKKQRRRQRRRDRARNEGSDRETDAAVSAEGGDRGNENNNGGEEAAAVGDGEEELSSEMHSMRLSAREKRQRKRRQKWEQRNTGLYLLDQEEVLAERHKGEVGGIEVQEEGEELDGNVDDDDDDEPLNIKPSRRHRNRSKRGALE